MQRIKDFLSPTPSLAIVKFWQGIVEIVLRSVAIVLCFLVFICAAVTSTRTAFSLSDAPSSNSTVVDVLSLRDSTHGLAGWVIFGCFAVMVYEGVVITLRFLNLEVLSNYIGIFLITDIVLHVLFALSVFIEGIIFAVFGGTTWVSFQERLPSLDVDYSNIESASQAVAAFLFLSLPIYVALVVWIGIWLFARWQQNITKILREQTGPTLDDTKDLDPSQEDY